MTPLKKHIFICENYRDPSNPKGCCAAKGGAELKNLFKQLLAEKGLKKEYRANSAGCLDVCEHGAALVIYPQNIWYGGIRQSDVPEIIEKSIINNEIIQRFVIKEKINIKRQKEAK
jgi:(2Fe-2S) ferredoxin